MKGRRNTVAFWFAVIVLVIATVLALIPDQLALHRNTAALPPPTPSPTAPTIDATASITVDGAVWGQSSCYIGAVEGSSRFAISDLQDLGINAYHIYGGMSRWEAQDDSAVYGSPSIAQIKANPNVINWAWWDNAMTNPPQGSDYSWTQALPEWHGNARTLFSTLKAAGIRPIITLRNKDDQNAPGWSPNPPQTTADWNEWWEHVFALVYWLNVRNNYDINDFEVLNEPDLWYQGWGGTESQYFTLVQYTHDAIDFVYKTYLPGRTYHLFAPATADHVTWVRDALRAIPTAFNTADVHAYGSFTSNVIQTHQWMNATGHSDYPLWITEWGTYIPGQYDSVARGVQLISNLISGSSPGNSYVYGSTIFSLYDYGTIPTGLISATGVRRADYYALRMAIRALNGCRPTHKTTVSVGTLSAITTTDADGRVYLLVANPQASTTYAVNANIAQLVLQGRASLWQFGAGSLDTAAGQRTVANGMVSFVVPANGAVLVEVVPRP